MNAETDLQTLIREMKPVLNPGEYVFCRLGPDASLSDPELIGWFREQEGTTAILPRARAEAAGLAYSFVGAWITLTVHSSLEAVGLTAAVSNALAKAGISCNIVAAFHHDHLFVPMKDAANAMQALEGMSRAARQSA
jgi:hypothetical protein